MDKYFTFDEVCELWGISQPTLSKILQTGKLEAYKVGANWRFSQEQLDAYLERNKHPANNDR
jgi:excisionase family DNA binding protein